MDRVKVILTIMLIFLIAIQFVPVSSNQDSQLKKTGFTKIYPVPAKVQAILKKSCDDCHSNYTQYPWYANLQPVSGWMASHISKGKRELNFSEFGSYSKYKQKSKLKAIINSIQDGTMPLASYTLIHKNAKLSPAAQTLVINWMEQMEDSLSLTNQQ